MLKLSGGFPIKVDFINYVVSGEYSFLHANHISQPDVFARCTN